MFKLATTLVAGLMLATLSMGTGSSAVPSLPSPPAEVEAVSLVPLPATSTLVPSSTSVVEEETELPQEWVVQSPCLIFGLALADKIDYQAVARLEVSCPQGHELEGRVYVDLQGRPDGFFRAYHVVGGALCLEGRFEQGLRDGLWVWHEKPTSRFSQRWEMGERAQ